jgi:hypothetical protein
MRHCLTAKCCCGKPHTKKAVASHLEPEPGGHMLQAPRWQQLLLCKAVHARPVGHPQRNQTGGLLQQQQQQSGTCAAAA